MSNRDHIKFYKVSLLLTVDSRRQGGGGSPVNFIEVPDGCPAEILSIGYEPRISVRTASPPCDECGSSLVYDYPLDPRNLCLGCLDAADPRWREKKLGIKVEDE